jgi:hypothetical protein
MLAWLLAACGGDEGKGDDAAGTAETATPDTTEVNEGCLRRCTRGSDGVGCDAAAIEATCRTYCVDPPPLPETCETAFQSYETCVAPIRDYTCDGSGASIDGVTVPVPADPYECFVEARELELPCVPIANPACSPTLTGAGSTCGADLVDCSADGETFDASLLCDGTQCSMLVAGGAQTLWPRADLLCAELAELQARDPALAAEMLVVLAGY